MHDRPGVHEPDAIPTPGRRLRRAARILLTDPAGRLLLFRFTPAGVPAFWCTPGGECDAGEAYAAAARRELREETGLDLPPGPEVHRIVADFVIFTGEAITADERYFRVAAPHDRVHTHGHTALEREVMQEHRWFTREDLASWTETIYPLEILKLL
ncbi:MAG: NUDIX domain-containing protein [Sphingomonadales bacterium]|nr:NUDIX domain-containing protein [Sphingomonadales bacterium]